MALSKKISLPLDSSAQSSKRQKKKKKTSTETTGVFDMKGSNTTVHSSPLNVFIPWLESSSSVSAWHYMLIESVFWSTPNIRVIFLSDTLSTGQFRFLTNAGLHLEIWQLHLQSLFADTALESLLPILHSAKNRGCGLSSDLLAMSVLYKYGGAFVAPTLMMVKSLTSLPDAFIDVPENSNSSPALWKFQAQSIFLEYLMKLTVEQLGFSDSSKNKDKIKDTKNNPDNEALHISVCRKLSIQAALSTAVEHFSREGLDIQVQQFAASHLNASVPLARKTVFVASENHWCHPLESMDLQRVALPFGEEAVCISFARSIELESIAMNVQPVFTSYQGVLVHSCIDRLMKIFMTKSPVTLRPFPSYLHRHFPLEHLSLEAYFSMISVVVVSMHRKIQPTHINLAESIFREAPQLHLVFILCKRKKMNQKRSFKKLYTVDATVIFSRKCGYFYQIEDALKYSNIRTYLLWLPEQMMLPKKGGFLSSAIQILEGNNNIDVISGLNGMNTPIKSKFIFSDSAKTPLVCEQQTSFGSFFTTDIPCASFWISRTSLIAELLIRNLGVIQTEQQNVENFFFHLQSVNATVVIYSDFTFLTQHNEYVPSPEKTFPRHCLLEQKETDFQEQGRNHRAALSIRNESKIYLAVAVVIKDEARDIAEWIEFHLIQGFQHFYIYDDGSSDQLLNVLDPYLHQGSVTLFNVKAEGLYKASGIGEVNTQINCFKHALKMCKESVRWLAFFDVDEFVAPLDVKRIPSVIDFMKIAEGYAAVQLRTVLYGTSGVVSMKTNSLVIDTFDHRQEYDFIPEEGSVLRFRLAKSIVDPLYALPSDNAHQFFFSGDKFAVDDSFRKVHSVAIYSVPQHLRIDHFKIKSYADYEVKISKPVVQGNKASKWKEFGNSFHGLDRNEVQDAHLKKWVHQITECLLVRKTVVLLQNTTQMCGLRSVS